MCGYSFTNDAGWYLSSKRRTKTGRHLTDSPPARTDSSACPRLHWTVRNELLWALFFCNCHRRIRCYCLFFFSIRVVSAYRALSDGRHPKAVGCFMSKIAHRRSHHEDSYDEGACIAGIFIWSPSTHSAANKHYNHKIQSDSVWSLLLMATQAIRNQSSRRNNWCTLDLCLTHNGGNYEFSHKCTNIEGEYHMMLECWAL